MAVLIPVEPGTASLTQRVSLDATIYILRLTWNQRAASWYLGIYSATDEPLVVGLPLRASTPINRHARHIDGAPKGVFHVFDSTGRGVSPTFEDLGVRVALVYLSEGEIAELPGLAGTV